MLFKGSRFTLVQPVLSGVPIYNLFLFQVPVGVAKKIEEPMRDILWEGICERKKDHFISWELSGDVSPKGFTLLDKWLWRFHLERELGELLNPLDIDPFHKFFIFFF